MSGNTKLMEYGIQTDESDYRIHVSFGAGAAYFFPTASGKKAIDDELGKPFRASQRGTTLITGTGRKVPWKQIDECQEIHIPDSWLRKIDCQKTDSTTDKGQKAQKIAIGLLKRGLVPLPLTCKIITDKQIQIRGKDIIIIPDEFSIEIKCDFWGGRYGLALQTHECNPFGRR